MTKSKATVVMEPMGWREAAREIIRYDPETAKEILAEKRGRQELRDMLARELVRYRSMFGADAA